MEEQDEKWDLSKMKSRPNPYAKQLKEQEQTLKEPPVAQTKTTKDDKDTQERKFTNH